jgi:hypothetical protein
MYPVKDRLINQMIVSGFSSALVDVGGGMGQTLEDFRVHVPEYTGDLVLQDLPEVVEAARMQGLHARISLQAHDFFTPQPVKGARAYFMRSVLHDVGEYPRAALKGYKNSLALQSVPYSRLPLGLSDLTTGFTDN